MFLYLFEKIDQGAVTLEGDAADKLDDLRGELERGVAQLRGENYDRIIITADVPVEGDESISLVNTIRGIGEDFYGAGNILTIGNITRRTDKTIEQWMIENGIEPDDRNWNTIAKILQRKRAVYCDNGRLSRRKSSKHKKRTPSL